jgi:DNA-binding HxlR family transcriptional regulator
MEEADPVAVYYGLTEKGDALVPVLDEPEAWGREWADGVPGEEPPRGLDSVPPVGPSGAAVDR